jgi:tripartite-type tricarboxylate transporter receptor subunit TctC
MIRQPQIMLANPSLAARTVPELIAYAKANPGKITTTRKASAQFNAVSVELAVI